MMIKRLKDFFWKSDVGVEDTPKKGERVLFLLKLDDLVIGKLSFDGEVWHFNYTEEFKAHVNILHTIPGFPKTEKEYSSEFLWPFFKVRIPGLKQPAIKEIIKKEAIPQNEVSLLKRFGFRSISSPYLLES